MFGPRVLVVATAVTGALALTASPAAATVGATPGGPTITIVSDAADDVVTVACSNGQSYVEGPGELTLPCDQVSVILVGPADKAKVWAQTVNLGGVTQLAFPALDHTDVDVDDVDADSVTGSEARDVVHADPADTVTGGSGNDWIDGAGIAVGGEGDDTLRRISGETYAGAGDDLIVDPGGSSIDGGPGFDTVRQNYASDAMPRRMVLSISDALLGPAPGVGAAVAGIEKYELTSSVGQLDDAVDSSAFSGRVTLTLNGGNDTFQGGPGIDTVDGGSGDDVIDPGTGNDVVHGGSGNDTIRARDGFADVVDCGDGVDTVTADRTDQMIGCENIVLPPPDTSAIAGPKRVVKPAKAFFTFASSVQGSTFECRVDAKPFKACASPFTVKTRKLRAGMHTLTVRAVQPAGNADPTPSTFRFKVKRAKR